MTSEIRRCSSSDKEQILKVVSYAYSIPEASHERFLERLEIIADEFFIHLLDEEATAASRLIPFQQNIRGVMKKMGGIGMVASVPEYRREGFVRDLMLHTLNEIKKEGYAVSTLYPFKDTFYSALSYVKMPMIFMMQVDPKRFSRVRKPDGYTASREKGDDAIKAWRSIQEYVIMNTHGTVLRTNKRWQELTGTMRSNIVLARNSKGQAEGVIVYAIKGYGEGHSWAETGQISIIEIYWKNLKARDTLLHFLYKHEDQIMNIKMVLGTTMDDYYQWISDFHTPKMEPHIISMARIVDVESSFSGIAVPSDGEISIQITDSILADNTGVYRFTGKDGLLVVQKVDEKSDTILTIEGATALLYGTLSEEQLRHLDWLEGTAPSYIFDWFSRKTPWLTEDF